MSSPAISAEADAGIESVARIMRDADVGFIPVVSKGNVVGVVTDRDLVLRALVDIAAIVDVTLADIMVAPIRVCRVDTPVSAVAAIMGDYQIRRLPVLDQEIGLVGVISIGDIAENVSEQIAGEVLGEVTEDR